MKVRFRSDVTYLKPVPEFDGEVEWVTTEVNVPNEKVHVVCEAKC